MSSRAASSALLDYSRIVNFVFEGKPWKQEGIMARVLKESFRTLLISVAFCGTEPLREVPPQSPVALIVIRQTFVRLIA